MINEHFTQTLQHMLLRTHFTGTKIAHEPVSFSASNPWLNASTIWMRRLVHTTDLLTCLCEKWVFTQRAFIEETAGHTHLPTSTPLFSPAAINVSLWVPRFPRESIQLRQHSERLCNPAASSLIWDAWAHSLTSCLLWLCLTYCTCGTWWSMVLLCALKSAVWLFVSAKWFSP